MIKIYENGYVICSEDIYVSSDIQITFEKSTIERTILLYFISISTADKIPIPENIKVCDADIIDDNAFLLYIDRKYTILLDGEILFETRPAFTEIQVDLIRAKRSFSPFTQRMLNGNE